MGHTIPIVSVTAAKEEIQKLRDLHPKAVHVCFAWRIGIHNFEDRHSDDGEPNNSAGKPIFGQIVAADITNTLIAVVRYYGGVNLGVGGLITAYKTAAKEAIKSGEIIERYEEVFLTIKFNPNDTGDAMAIVNRSQANILNHNVDMDGHFIECRIRKGFSDKLIKDLKKTAKFTIQLNQ